MSNFKKISVDQAKELLKEEGTLLFDARDTESYNKDHIEGAILLTDKNIGSFVNDSANKKQVLIIICYHGNSSQGVAQYFSLQGFERVYSVIGGYEKWYKDKE